MRKSTLFHTTGLKMAVHTLTSLIVLAGVGSCFPETWDKNLTFHLALLSLFAEAVKCEPRSVWDCFHRISWGKVKKPRKGVSAVEQSQSCGRHSGGKILSV